MLRLNTIVRSYRAGDDVIFSMPEKNGLFLVLSGGVRVFIATDTGREITLMSIVSGGCCMLNTLDSARCARNRRSCSSFCSARRRAMSRRCSIT